MGTIIRVIVILAFVEFIYSLFFGGIRTYGKGIFRLARAIVVVICISYFLRGAWIPNAGGGVAIREDASEGLAYEDFAVSIPIKSEQEESVDHCLEYYIDHTSSKTYNPELSHLLISLCNSVHDEAYMRQAFDNLGFPTEEPFRELNYNMKDLLLAYGMGKKQLTNGTEIVLIVTRGTGDDIKEIISDLNVSVDHYGRHSGFSNAASKLHKRLMDFLGNNADYSKTIFVLTGHSRGAAVVNITAAMLADEGIPQEHIYCYSFACPDTAFLSDDKAKAYSCIYNIGNVNDIVSWTPWNIWKESGSNYGFGSDTYWNKYGQSFWYSESEWQGELDANITNFFSEHSQEAYLCFLARKKGVNEYKERNEASRLIDEG